MGRTKRAISEVYGELKEGTKEVGLIINVDKMKAMVQNRRLGKGGTLTVEDHKIEVVRRFKYLAMMKRKKSELVSWQLIKPTAPCKPYSDLDKCIKTTKQDCTKY